MISSNANSKEQRRGRRELAATIRDSNRIALATSHVSGEVDDATARHNIIDTAQGQEARRSNYGNAPGGTVALDETMLQGLIDLATFYTFSVSEIAGGSHSTNSRHYFGVAFDVNQINGAAVNANNGDFRQFMQVARNLGATEVLGPGDAAHDTHVHAAWPRP